MKKPRLVEISQEDSAELYGADIPFLVVEEEATEGTVAGE